MKILVLGGTRFVGRHLTEAALAAGHTVTLFNRGQSNTDLFPEVEKRRGDRDGGLDSLGSGEWDAVLDVNGYVPRLVRDSVNLLRDRVPSYCFISTGSVYATMEAGRDERSPLVELDDPTVEAITWETYGGLKVLCERAVVDAYGDSALIVRPGLVVGPHDHTDRWTYWPRRVSEGGDMLAPEGPDHPMQTIDARDMAAWIIDMIAAGSGGVYNAPGKAGTFGAMLDLSAQITGADIHIHWASEDFLLDQDVAPWTDLPLWLPREDAGAFKTSTAKGQSMGLTLRPVEDTIRDTLAWADTRPADHQWAAGIDRQREAELLAAWQAAQS